MGASAEAPSVARTSPVDVVQGEKPDTELDLLGRARSALASDPSIALAIADAAAARFPAGALAQEREMIAIDALTRLGRTPDASARAASFVERYPTSAYRPRIDSLIRANP